ncbi:hypothetical protein ACVBEH_05730 [Roseateles sp. GG27B]
MQQKLPRQEGRDDARHGLLLDRMRALALAFIPAKSVLNMSKNSLRPSADGKESDQSGQ